MFRMLIALVVALGLCVIPMGCGDDVDYAPEELGHDPDQEVEERDFPEPAPIAPAPLDQ